MSDHKSTKELANVSFQDHNDSTAPEALLNLQDAVTTTKSETDDDMNALAITQHPLVRDPSKGMNPVHLTTGYYGPRGEKIRHVVHEGALRLPSEALEIILSTTSNRDKKDFELPGLDALVRPSRDPSISTLTVTQVTGMLVPADPVAMRPATLRTLAQNLVMRVPKITAVAADANETERIRGGGAECDDPSSSQQQQQEETATFPSPSPAPGKGVPTIAAPPEVVSSDPPPATTTSFEPQPSTNIPVTSTSEPLAQVIPLPKKPDPQWQQHLPGANDDIQVDTTNSAPQWYKPDSVSDLEKTALPEWFDGSAPHRTTESYIATRERILEMSNKLANRYLTGTMVRRSIPGDIGSLLRLHHFLTVHSMINDDAMNDSAPTPVVLQDAKSKYRWSEPMRTELFHAVVEQSRKRPKLESGFVPINWEDVAKSVGHGVQPKDCERQFLAMPMPPVDSNNDGSVERSDKPDAFSEQQTNGTMQQVLQSLVEKSDPKVLDAVTSAALRTTNNLPEAQTAAVVGLVASRAVSEARSREDAVAHLLSEIVDLRMKKLENRLALLDDVEGMLEAERVALELERRDLYTARCRNWFGSD